MKLRDVDFEIHCDGKALPEYQVKVDTATNTVTTFIPSEAGKDFQIRWKSSRPEHLEITFTIDGNRVKRTLYPPHDIGSAKGVHITNNVIRPLQFSKVVLLDDESLPLNNIATGKLGTIELGVTRMRRRGVLSYNPAPLDIKGIGPMHEKSKKVGGHCVSYGQAIAGPAMRWVQVEPMFPQEGIWAKFIFQYRPEELLRAQSIIEPPRVTDPVQSGSGNVSVKRSRSAAFSDNNRVGNSSSTSQGPPNKKVKREQRDDDVIDLTMVGEDAPKLLDPSLRGTIIDLTLDD